MTRHIIPTEVLAQHTAILGKTGSGKSSTAKIAVEQVVDDGFRVCILDTIKSDWWGLTSSADGKKPGLPFKILGGPRGHVPLHSSAGKAIGYLVGQGKLPLSILDMADFEPGGVQKFFSDFAAELMRSMRGVLYLVVEEAHEVAPKERAGFGAENLSIHWAKKLATAGRSKGIRLIVLTQRVQSLHNAVLGSCETVIAHRLTTPADQAPIVAWLKANADKKAQAAVEASLSSLPTGTAWVCSGEAKIFEKIAFPKFKTYDNAATPTGDDFDHDVKTAQVDQAELRAIIGDALKEAEANDPKALKAKVAQLTKELSGKAPTAIDPEAERKAEARGETRGRAAGFDEGLRVGFAEGEKAALRKAQSALGAIQADEPTLAALPARAAPNPALGQVTTALDGMKPLPAPRFKPARTIASGTGVAMPSTLAKGERTVLVSVAQHANGVTRKQLTVLTGYKVRSRDTYLQKLKQSEYVEQIGDRLRATDAGIDALGGAFEPPLSGDQLRNKVLVELPQGERRLLEILIASYPLAVARDALGEQTGYAVRSRDTYLQKLSARELVVVAARGMVKASDDLFDEAA